MPSNPKVADADDVISLDDELADTFVQLAFALGLARVRRCLWLVHGWPHRMARILVPELAEETAAQFLQDLALFEELRDLRDSRRAERERL